jgi:hypothetical protein
MSMYRDLIREATGETSEHKLAEIEDVMRHDIFHSTLDWQTRKQLIDAAREANAVLDYIAREDAKL